MNDGAIFCLANGSDPRYNYIPIAAVHWPLEALYDAVAQSRAEITDLARIAQAHRA